MFHLHPSRLRALCSYLQRALVAADLGASYGRRKLRKSYQEILYDVHDVQK